jgi:hypothetical protein
MPPEGMGGAVDDRELQPGIPGCQPLQGPDRPERVGRALDDEGRTRQRREDPLVLEAAPAGRRPDRESQQHQSTGRHLDREPRQDSPSERAPGVGGDVRIGAHPVTGPADLLDQARRGPPARKGGAHGEDGLAAERVLERNENRLVRTAAEPGEHQHPRATLGRIRHRDSWAGHALPGTWESA